MDRYCAPQIFDEDSTDIDEELGYWPSKPKKGGSLRHKFSKTEDETLRRLVAQHGEASWAIVAACMENRTARQCRERFKNYLSPTIKNGPWTPEEEALLERKYKEFGPKWAKIALCFEQRSDVNVKNHWTAMYHRHTRERQIVTEKTDVLQQLEASVRPCCPIPEIDPMAVNGVQVSRYGAPMQNQMYSPIQLQRQMQMYRVPIVRPPVNHVMPMVRTNSASPQISVNIPSQPGQETPAPPQPAVPTPPPPQLLIVRSEEGDNGTWGAQDEDMSFQFDNSFDTSYDLFM